MIALEDFDPANLVSANRRIHHYERSRLCNFWRTKASRAAQAAYGLADEGESWHQRVRVVVTVRFPDRRRHDVGNLYPYVAKPIVDGLVDARIVSDDDDRHVIGPDLRRDPERGPHRIVVEVIDLQTPPEARYGPSEPRTHPPEGDCPSERQEDV